MSGSNESNVSVGMQAGLTLGVKGGSESNAVLKSFGESAQQASDRISGLESAFGKYSDSVAKKSRPALEELRKQTTSIVSELEKQMSALETTVDKLAKELTRTSEVTKKASADMSKSLAEASAAMRLHYTSMLDDQRGFTNESANTWKGLMANQSSASASYLRSAQGLRAAMKAEWTAMAQDEAKARLGTPSSRATQSSMGLFGAEQADAAGRLRYGSTATNLDMRSMADFQTKSLVTQFVNDLIKESEQIKNGFDKVFLATKEGSALALAAMREYYIQQATTFGSFANLTQKNAYAATGVVDPTDQLTKSWLQAQNLSTQLEALRAKDASSRAAATAVLVKAEVDAAAAEKEAGLRRWLQAQNLSTQLEALRAKDASSRAAATAVLVKAEVDAAAAAKAAWNSTWAAGSGVAGTHSVVTPSTQASSSGYDSIMNTTRATAGLTSANTALAGSTSNASAGAKRLRDEQSQLNAIMHEGHSAARGLAQGFGAMVFTYGSILPLLAGAAISNALVKTFQEGSDLERQLTFVSQLTDKGTISVQMFEEAMRGSQTSVKEGAEGLRALAQSGFDSQQALLALPDILKLATVGEVSVGQAALATTGIMHAFNMELGDIPHIVDVLTMSAAKSNTSVASMMESLKTASVGADQFHVSLETMSAALEIMGKRNITGTAAGTALKNVMTELAEPTKKAADRMKQLGLDAYDSTGQLKPLEQVMGELKQKMVGLNEAGVNTVLGDLFNERGRKGAAALLKDMDDFLFRIERLKTGADGFAASVNAALGETVSGQVKTLANDFGMVLGGAFESTTDAWSNLVADIADFVKSTGFKDAITAVSTVILGLAENIDKIAMAAAAWYLGMKAGAIVMGAVNVVAAEQVAVTMGMAAATETATLATTVFSTVLSRILWPVAIVSGLIIAYQALKGSVDESSEAHTRLMRETETASEQMRKTIKDLQDSSAAYIEAARTGGAYADILVRIKEAGKARGGFDKETSNLAKATQAVADAEDNLNAAQARGVPVDELVAASRTMQSALLAQQKAATNYAESRDAFEKGQDESNRVSVERTVQANAKEMDNIRKQTDSLMQALKDREAKFGPLKGKAAEAYAELARIQGSVIENPNATSSSVKILTDDLKKAKDAVSSLGTAAAALPKGNPAIQEHREQLQVFTNIAKSANLEIKELDREFTNSQAITDRNVALRGYTTEMESAARQAHDYTKAELQRVAAIADAEKAYKTVTQQKGVSSTAVSDAGAQLRTAVATALETEKDAKAHADIVKSNTDLAAVVKVANLDFVRRGKLISDEESAYQNIQRVTKAQNALDLIGKNLTVAQVAEMERQVTIMEALHAEDLAYKSAMLEYERQIYAIEHGGATDTTAINAAKVLAGEELARARVTANNKANADIAVADIAAATKVKQEYQKTFDRISDGLVSALTKGGHEGAQAVRDLLVKELFSTPFQMVIRALVSPVANAVAGAATSAVNGVAGSALSSAGGSLLGNASSMAALGSAAGSAFGAGAASWFTNGIAGTVDLMTTATGSLLADASFALGAVAAPLAIAVAAYSLFGGKGGGPKTESSYGLQAGLGDTSKTGMAGAYATGIEKSWDALAQKLGILTDHLRVGAIVSADPKGNDNTDFNASATVNGQTVYDRWSRMGGRDAAQTGRTDAELQAAMTEEVSRVMFAALKASGISEQEKAYLATVGSSIDEINTAMDNVVVVHDFTAALKDLPFEYLTNMSFNAAKGLIEAAGGLDKLGTNMGGFYANFYSADEKQALLLANTTKSFETLGLKMPAVDDGLKAAYRAEVERLGAMDLSVEANAKAYAGALALQSNVNTLADGFTSASTATAQAAQVVADALAKIDGAVSSANQTAVALGMKTDYGVAQENWASAQSNFRASGAGSMLDQYSIQEIVGLATNTAYRQANSATPDQKGFWTEVDKLVAAAGSMANANNSELSRLSSAASASNSANATVDTSAADAAALAEMKRIADERQGIQDQIDQLTMTGTQLLEKQRNALDESNRSLFANLQLEKQRAAALTATADYQKAMWTATGDTASLALRNRQDDTKAKLASGWTQSQIDNVYGAQEAAAAAKTTTEFNRALLEASGDTSGLAAFDAAAKDIALAASGWTAAMIADWHAAENRTKTEKATADWAVAMWTATGDKTSLALRNRQDDTKTKLASGWTQQQVDGLYGAQEAAAAKKVTDAYDAALKRAGVDSTGMQAFDKALANAALIADGWTQAQVDAVNAAQAVTDSANAFASSVDGLTKNSRSLDIALATANGDKAGAAAMTLADAIKAALVGVTDPTQQASITSAVTGNANKQTEIDRLTQRNTLQDQLNALTDTATEALTRQRNALDASNQSLFDKIQIETKAKEVESERKGLQDQLNALQDTAAQALTRQRDALDESNRAIFDKIQLETKAKAVAEEQKGLQDQLNALTDTATEALTRQRDALDASNRTLFDQVQSATKAKAVAAERTTLQDQLNGLTDTATEALTRQRNALDETNRALFDQVQAQQTLKAVAEASAAVTKTLKDSTTSLLIELFTAQGNTGGAKALTFATETAGMDAAQIAIYNYNQSLRDQTKAANDAAAATADLKAKQEALAATNKGWQDQLDVLENRQTDRSITLRDATDDTTRTLMKQVYAQQDLKAASQIANDKLASWGSTMKGLGDTKGSLTVEKMTAEGRAADAKALQRQIDLSAMTLGITSEQAAAVTTAYDYNQSVRDNIETLNAAAAATKALAATNKQWKDQLDVLTGAQTDRSIALRDATDESTRTLMKQVWAQQDLAKATQEATAAADAALAEAKSKLSTAESDLRSAYNAQKSALQGTADAFGSFVKSLLAYKNQLLHTDSTLSPEEAYARAKKAFSDTSALANSGDQTALGDLQSVSQQMLDASKAYNASGAGYQSDLQAVLNELDSAGRAASIEKTIAEQQLAELTQQVSALITIDTSVKSVEQAIRDYIAAQGAVKTAGAAAAATTPTVSAPTAAAAAATPASGFTSDIYGSADRKWLSTLLYGPQESVKLSDERIAASLAASVKYGEADALKAAAAKMGAASFQSAINDLATEFSTYAQTVIDNPSRSKVQRDGWAADLANLKYLTDPTLRGFGDGGFATPGWAMVGEGGPEVVNFAEPARVYTAAQTRAALNGNGDNEELVKEMQATRAVLNAIMARIDQGDKENVEATRRVEKRMASLENSQRLAASAPARA